MTAFLNGFFLGASLIIAIGAQNAFILRQGLLKSHVFILSFICALADAVLIAAGVGGLGTLVASHPDMLKAVTAGGVLFLAAYSFKAFRRAAHPEAMTGGQGGSMPLGKAVAACLAFTLLNPHVYLDTVVLVGSVCQLNIRPASGWHLRHRRDEQLPLSGSSRSATARACCLPLFQKPRSWQVLDVIIGIRDGRTGAQPGSHLCSESPDIKKPADSLH